MAHVIMAQGARNLPERFKPAFAWRRSPTNLELAAAQGVPPKNMGYSLNSSKEVIQGIV